MGGGVGMVHDFESAAAWAAWEDTALDDPAFSALFAEVMDSGGPLVTPFKREFWRSIP